MLSHEAEDFVCLQCCIHGNVDKVKKQKQTIKKKKVSVSLYFTTRQSFPDSIVNKCFSSFLLVLPE